MNVFYFFGILVFFSFAPFFCQNAKNIELKHTHTHIPWFVERAFHHVPFPVTNEKKKKTQKAFFLLHTEKGSLGFFFFWLNEKS